MGMEIELLPLVDMDGILTKDERKRIIKRLHTILSWVGSQIPEKNDICGEHFNLRETVMDLVLKEELTKEDIECAKLLAQDLIKDEKDLEEEIIGGDITEEEALELLKEARGLLRAIRELENLEDRAKKIEAKDTLLNKVDDELRWKHFIDKLKK
jgi:RNA processing factor Prp31